MSRQDAEAAFPQLVHRMRRLSLAGRTARRAGCVIQHLLGTFRGKCTPSATTSDHRSARVIAMNA